MRTSLNTSTRWAYILLDRIANATEHCLGTALKPWNSLETRATRFNEYARNRNLEPPPAALLDSISLLRENLAAFRHRYVVHKHEGDDGRRLMRSYTYNADEAMVSLQFGLFFPQPGEDRPPAQGMTPIALSHEVGRFSAEWIAYLDRNIAPATRS